MKISLYIYCVFFIQMLNSQTPLIKIDSNAQNNLQSQLKQNGVDLSIFNQVCTDQLNYPSIGLPYYATFPLHQIRSGNDFYFNSQVELKNKGTSEARNIRSMCEVKFNNVIMSSHQEDIPKLEPSQKIISNVSNNLVITKSEEGTIHYSVSSDSNDLDFSNNSVDLNFIISDNHLSRSRFKLVDGEPSFTHEKFYPMYPSFNEIHMPFFLKYAKGAIIDTLYGSIYSETGLPNTLLEGRIYKWNDTNLNQIIDEEEIFLLGLAIETIDENYSSNKYSFRMPLIQIFEPANLPDSSALLIASIMVRNVSGLISFGFDSVYNHRLELIDLDKKSNVDINDYPYRLLYDSLRIPFNQGQIDYNILKEFICNQNGISVGDFLFAPASIAVHITEPDPTLVKSESINEIITYPNPTQDILNIAHSYSSTSKLQFEIFNQEGKKLFLNSSKSSHLIQIETSELSSGIYIIRLIKDSYSTTKKFIILR